MKKIRISTSLLAISSFTLIPSCSLLQSASKLPGSIATAVGRTIGVVKHIAEDPKPMTQEDIKFLDEFAKKQESEKKARTR